MKETLKIERFSLYIKTKDKNCSLSLKGLPLNNCLEYVHKLQSTGGVTITKVSINEQAGNEIVIKQEDQND